MINLVKEDHLRIDVPFSLNLILLYFFCNYFISSKLIDAPVEMIEFLQLTQRIMNYVVAVLAVLFVFFRSFRTLALAPIAILLSAIFNSFGYRAEANFLMILFLFALMTYFGFGVLRNLEKPSNSDLEQKSKKGDEQ